MHIIGGMMIMPATFALIPAMMHRKEERKLNYRAVFSLNVDLKKNMDIKKY